MTVENPSLNKYYTNDDIWVTVLLKNCENYLPGGVIVSVLLIGIFPTIFMLAFLISIQNLNTFLLFSQLLLLVVIVIIPMLIRYYDDTVFPKFIDQGHHIVESTEDFTHMINRWEKSFCKKYWITTILWTGLIVSTIIGSFPYFRNLGIPGYFNPTFGYYLLFAIWFGVFSSILIHMGITTVLCIREVGDMELQIDPLHPDGLGGLSNIGYFAIRATTILSIGALCFPFAFELVRQGGSELFVYAVVSLYIISLLVLFIYPTLYVNIKAQQVRENELEKRRKKIQDIREKVERKSTSISGKEVEIEKELKLQSLREEFKDFQTVSLYPLTISIVIRLVSSVLLPISFLLLDAYVFSA